MILQAISPRLAMRILENTVPFTLRYLLKRCGYQGCESAAALSALPYFLKQDRHRGFAMLVAWSAPQVWQRFSSKFSFLYLAQVL